MVFKNGGQGRTNASGTNLDFRRQTEGPDRQGGVSLRDETNNRTAINQWVRFPKR